MQRIQLLSDLVELDSRIIEATTLASMALDHATFEKLINEVRAMRQQRAEVQARLDVLEGSFPLDNRKTGLK